MENDAERNKRRRQFCGLLCLIPLWISCAAQHRLVLEPVGPHAASPASKLALAGSGFLQVHSATETREVGNFLFYFPHTAYSIYGTNGNRLRWVQNAVGDTDEAPSIVHLPAGFYTIVAQDTDYGRVTVPIVVEDAETTVVFLDASRVFPAEPLNAANVVCLPNGRIVGWKARVFP